VGCSGEAVQSKSTDLKDHEHVLSWTEGGTGLQEPPWAWDEVAMAIVVRRE
jgi:hypothetical protein